jgi:hypothetical protein
MTRDYGEYLSNSDFIKLKRKIWLSVKEGVRKVNISHDDGGAH